MNRFIRLIPPPIWSALRKVRTRLWGREFQDIRTRLSILERSFDVMIATRLWMREFQDIRTRPSTKYIRTRLSILEGSSDVMIPSPRYTRSDDVGFNGQRCRKKIFMDLVDAIKFDALIETGTWFGNTAGFMHETTRLPVYTCELNPRFYLVAKMRLADLTGITLELDDSRQFLRSLAGGRPSKQVVFFYLDAHWYEDLPLKGEIEIIALNWEKFVIMIDDFKVPGDEGYGFDSGQGKFLVLETIIDEMKTHGLRAFFPSFPSSEETGAKRGCVVLARRGALSNTISRLGSLRAEDFQLTT